MTKSLSRHPSQSPEDWDHPESMVDPSPSAVTSTTAPTTSRIAFPSTQGGAAADPDTPTPDSHRGGRAGKRTLSELLKLHAEKGTDVHFTSEEANRLEELLGQWVRPFLFFFSFFPLIPVFFVSWWVDVDLLLCWVVRVLLFCGRRSTQARRHTKGKMNFSHGRKMTRSCSCTARPLSTPLLGIPLVVRVRVLLSDHNLLPPSACSYVPPSSSRPPLSFRSRFHSACHTTAKSCAHDY